MTTTRKTKPGLKRLFLTLTVLFSFILGFPFLYKSIEIYRSPLPFQDIYHLSSRLEASPLQFPCHFQVVFLGFNAKHNNGSELGPAISNQVRELSSISSGCGSCAQNFDVSVTLDSGGDCEGNDWNSDKSKCAWQCGRMGAVNFFDNTEEDVDDMLESVLSGGYCRKVYTVVVVNGDDNVARAVVGKHRHAWLVGRLSQEEVVARVSEIFVKMFIMGGKEDLSIHGDFMPVGSDGKMVLSFNLLNADPQHQIFEWDFQTVEQVMLGPVLDALKPIADITVESQILYHTPKFSLSSWDDKSQGYIFTTKDLPFFVNSNEWHLDTSVAAGGRSKILQIAVYVPSTKECPLLLQLPNGKISETNGFISPTWGGVIVWNPPSCPNFERGNSSRRTMTSEDLQKVFDIFLGQLRQHFGLESRNHYVGLFGTYNLLSSEKGFTEWELDVLARQHACFNLLSCATTLSSLSRLVQSLPRMIIMDDIGKQVRYSLEAANLVQNNASLGVYDASAVSSREARSLAEDAFFHPSIMSVSYYSFEHCFAVYSPFFLPVAMHVILAALREWKRYKQETKKYMASKAGGSSAS
uniref:GPI transamidase component PIG-S n=1 Tax=Kalanchoe fedtschenkoi TaxID=63787 RepID=A0A7N0UUS1_KALFE